MSLVLRAATRADVPVIRELIEGLADYEKLRHECIATDALHLPVEAAIALFIAVDPIIDVFRTTVLVYGNCALTALVTPLEKDPTLWTSEEPNAVAAE